MYYSRKLQFYCSVLYFLKVFVKKEKKKPKKKNPGETRL